MSNVNTTINNNLNATSIPLQGKHLIEASAGTGKTHNITRIYLRLLLERNIPVEQILVMTFTKDATQELRGRIAAFIREALHQWDTLSVEDDYFAALACHVSPAEAKLRLKQALLFIDEAAIFTIHGFCKKVLSQHAFASGLPFNLTMESDCQEWMVEACEDWYRSLSVRDVAAFSTIANVWPTPSSFMQKFAKAIGKYDSLDVIEPNSLVEDLIDFINATLKSLDDNASLIQTALIETKKGAEREKREGEFAQLNTWLHSLKETVVSFNQTLVCAADIQQLAITPMPKSFFHAGRFIKAHKAALVEAFTPCNQLKSVITGFKKQLMKSFAFKEARTGIYEIRQNFTEKKQALQLLSFDDLISTLASKLANDADNVLATAIFNAYPVALVDEFQDTDPQQFALLKAIYYPQETSALYMIGDPKQAIYGFRGGDVFAYLSARSGCDYQWVMDTNWRSSPEMITGYNRLFYGNPLNESARDVFGYDIPYVPVKPSPKALEAQASGVNSTSNSAFNLVHFTSDDPKYVQSKSKGSLKQNFREVIAAWCANEIGQLLSQHKHQAHEIAILVRDSAEAKDIKQALEACNIQSVFMSNRANLLLSEQTQQLLLILKGILFVEDERKFSAALTSPLLNIPFTRFVELQADDLAWQSIKFKFMALRDQWQQHGFMSMAVKLMHDHFSISDDNRDRALTNVLHIFELLQKAMQKHRQPQELLQWFEHQITLDNPDVEAELRLESDDDLIRIITQHGSKGLEYPVVFIPYATRHKNPLKFGSSEVSFIEYHDNKGQLKLSLDGSKEAKQSMANEAYAESIRLLYVAVTRAELTCYICSAPFDGYEDSPLGKTLKWQKDADISVSLQQLASDEPQAIKMLTFTNVDVEVAPINIAPSSLTPVIPEFSGRIERDWWLSSFSALSRNLTFTGLSRPDRDIQSATVAQGNKALTFTASTAPDLRFTLTKGALTGNFLHDVLEHSDFTGPHWESLIPQILTRYNGLLEQEHVPELINWLDQIIHTDIGAVISLIHNEQPFSFTLADLPLPQTLREREFYFPMHDASTHSLLSTLKRHRYSDIDLNAQKSITAPIHLPNIAKLKGMMHGFIDLMFCHNDKYYICDYKSNYLGEHFEDYHQGAMRENIETHHYDLQYLIYTLALHRHLQLTLTDYDPKRHLGGVVYLYLRGMTTLPEHKGAGVYYRQIDHEEIMMLDKLFQGEVCHDE